MSSPIHHPKDLDPALMYAPPWARGESQPATNPHPAPPIEWPPQRRRPDDGRSFSGDRAVLEVKRQLALDPDMVPEPPSLEGDRAGGKMMLRICGAAGAAALAALVIVWLPASRLFEHETVQANTAATPALVAAIRPDGAQAAAAAPVAVHDEHEAAAAPPPPTPPAPTPPIRLGANSPVSQVAPAPQLAPAPQPQPAPPERSALRLDDREIAALVMRGEAFIANRDLASARLVLQRAAEAGSAEAAMALASTFDPLVIQSLGAVSSEPDLARARKWYQKAIELGSTAASQQLAKLAEERQ
ncbi:MAG TPA: hypothetical protein VEJ37_10120 [Xanthobacteraceae bacterium]|nr:hypothetical protein [Xanthobacteraceae bacterium]